MTKKNILIISPLNPYPLISGGHQAIFNGIAILKDIANVFILIDTTESKWKRGDKEIEKVLPFVKVLPYIDPKSRHTFLWYCNVFRNKITALFPKRKHHLDSPIEVKNQPHLGIDEIAKDKINIIQQYICQYNIEIVQVEMMENIRIIEHLPSNIQKIFVHHELRFVRNELLAKSRGILNDDIQKRLNDDKTEEIRLLNMYNNVITLSSTDTRKLKIEGVNVPIITSFAVVNPIIQAVKVDSRDNLRKVISYVGPENHYPNYEGVLWFLQNCWGELHNRDMEYTFQIIGNWSQETSRYIETKYKGVFCIGFVENLVMAIRGTTMIVPLNIGSGIRMKILEAAQIGVPVVSTPIGAEGLPLVNGVHAFITADPKQFVEDILLLNDNKLRNTFVKNTRKIITNVYSLKALKNNRQSVYY